MRQSRLACWTLVTLLLLPWLPAAGAEDEVAVAVMEFASKGGVTQEQMDALGDLVANEIRSLGTYRVLGKEDIRATLQIEEQKQLLGCTEASCAAELGGALGARWVVVGNVSLFGSTFLLNLKLMDVVQVRVHKGLSRSIAGGQDALLAEVPAAVRDLFASLRADLRGDAPAPAGDTSTDEPPLEPQEPEPEPGPRTWFTTGDPDGWVITAGGGAIDLGTFHVTSGQPVDPLISTTEIGVGRLDVGYRFLPWLVTGVRIGGGMATYYYADTSNPGDRRRSLVDAGAFVEFAWPFDFWLRPTAGLGLGLCMLADKNLSSGGEPDSSSPGLVFEAWLGGELYFTSHWLLGLRLGWGIRHFTDIQTNDQTKGNFRSPVGWIYTGWQF